jgi:uncharacterized protein YgfB (UPF0149 family)
VEREDDPHERGDFGGDVTCQGLLQDDEDLGCGLANAELRGAVLPNLPAGDEEEAWRQALITVIAGFSAGGTAAG